MKQYRLGLSNPGAQAIAQWVGVLALQILTPTWLWIPRPHIKHIVQLSTPIIPVLGVKTGRSQEVAGGLA